MMNAAPDRLSTLRGPSVAVTCTIGVLVAVVTALPAAGLAWATLSGNFSEHAEIRRELGFLRSRAAQFEAEYLRTPASVDELAAEWPAEFTDRKVDPWGRPYFVERDDDGVRLTTLGKDGRRGGRGFDADITTDDVSPSQSPLPLDQFLVEPRSLTTIFVASLAGLLAGTVTAMQLRQTLPSARSIVGQLCWLAIWMFVAANGAVLVGSSSISAFRH